MDAVDQLTANMVAHADEQNHRREQARERAKKVFRHYMADFHRKAYGTFAENDNFVEWDGIIDDIIEAAR